MGILDILNSKLGIVYKKISPIVYKYDVFGLPLIICILFGIDFLLSFSEMSSVISINETLFNILDLIKTIVLYSLLLIELTDSSTSIKTKFIFLLITFILFVNFYIYTYTSMFYELFIIAYIVRKYELKTIFNYLLCLFSSIFLINFAIFVVKSLSGQIDFFVIGRGLFGASYLGTVYYNTAAMFIGSLLLMYVYVYNNNKTYIIATLINVITFILTTSRTAFLVSQVAIITFFLCDKFDFIKTLLNKLSYVIFPFFSVVLVNFTFLYMKGNSIGLFVNKLLTGRLKLNASAFSNVSLTFMGRSESIRQYINGGNLDSLYIHSFFKYGLIIYFLLMIIFYLISKKENINNSILIFIFSLYAISETAMIDYRYYAAILVVVEFFKYLDEQKIDKETI